MSSGSTAKSMISFVKISFFSTLLFFWIIADSKAVAPPPQGQDLPAHIAEGKAIMALEYGQNGIARRLQENKYQNEQNLKNSSAKQANMTNWAIPVLMGSYSDVAHIFTSTNFQSTLFGPNPTGNMTDYFDEVSYNTFNVTGTVYGPFTAASPQSYYAVNNGFNLSASYPQNASGFIISILGSADGSIDFSQYDNDGPDGTPNSGDDDGVVDAVVVIFPDGDASGGDSDNIWAHQYTLSSGSGSSFTTNDARFGGGSITINQYTIQGAEQGNGTLDVIKPIGVYCHEFGHILGLPDLYDTDNSSYGVGTWCLMGLGSWGAGWSTATENRPTHMGAWCKKEMGWITPTVVTGTQALTIPPVETNATAYKLWDDAYQGGRYFLVENRTQTGFDGGISGEGLLVWHCNDDVFHDNSDDNFRQVDLEEADGLAQIDSKLSHQDGGDLFPGTSNNTSFNDATNPAATDAFGAASGVSISSIAAGAGKDINCNATQRQLDGYTVSLNGVDWVGGWGFSTPTLTYGAARMTASAPGDLVAIQTAARSGSTMNYSIRIFNDISGSTPTGLQSTTAGSLPSVNTDRYHQITLSSPMTLSNGQNFFVDIGFGPASFAVPYVSRSPVSGNSWYSSNGTSYTNWSDKDVALTAKIQYSPLSTNENLSGLPAGYALEQNYPNPFNPETVIKYTLPERAEVELTIFNLLGREVITLVDESKPAGEYSISWNGLNNDGEIAASGVYFYRLKAGEAGTSRKMVMLK